MSNLSRYKTNKVVVYVTATRRVPEVPWLLLGRGCCVQEFWILPASCQLASSCVTPQQSCKCENQTTCQLLYQWKTPASLSDQIMDLFFSERFRYTSHLVALAEIFSSNWWSSTLQCWREEGQDKEHTLDKSQVLEENRGAFQHRNKVAPVAVWGLSVLPLRYDTGQNHSPLTVIYLEIKPEWGCFAHSEILGKKICMHPR